MGLAVLAIPRSAVEMRDENDVRSVMMCIEAVFGNCAFRAKKIYLACRLIFPPQINCDVEL